MVIALGHMHAQIPAREQANELLLAAQQQRVESENNVRRRS
jgi:hypothetical protein